MLDSETKKNIELIEDMRIKLSHLFTKQNEMGLVQAGNQKNDKAQQSSRANSTRASMMDDMKLPSIESFNSPSATPLEASPEFSTNRKTFFPF